MIMRNRLSNCGIYYETKLLTSEVDKLSFHKDKYYYSVDIISIVLGNWLLKAVYIHRKTIITGCSLSLYDRALYLISRHNVFTSEEPWVLQLRVRAIYLCYNKLHI